MSGITDNPSHPDINQPGPDGQNKVYLVLSAEERAKGFVRPVRRSYKHIGQHERVPAYRDLEPAERIKAGDEWELGVGNAWKPAVSGGLYNPGTGVGQNHRHRRPIGDTVGRIIKKGCGATTTMGLALAETYARKPSFYNATFCVTCGGHFPLDQFVWEGTDEMVGT